MCRFQIEQRDAGVPTPTMHSIFSVEPTSTRQLHRIVVEAAQAVEFAKRVGPHAPWHSSATNLLEDSIGIRVVEALLRQAKLDNAAF